MELSNSNIKKLLIYSKMKPCISQSKLKKLKKKSILRKFLMLQERKTPPKTYIFSKESCSYISGNRNPEKILYISGNGTFLYLRK